MQDCTFVAAVTVVRAGEHGDNGVPALEPIEEGLVAANYRHQIIIVTEIDSSFLREFAVLDKEEGTSFALK